MNALDTGTQRDEVEAMRSLEPGQKVFVMNVGLHGAGFGACILATINQARYCDRRGYLPVARYDRDCRNAFFDPDHGNSMWEQYFEPLVPGWASGDVDRRVQDPSHPLAEDDVVSLPDTELWAALEDPDSVASFTYADWRYRPPEDLSAWYDEQRRRARETIRKYIRPRREIVERVDEFWKSHAEGAKVLGIHMRGTDFHYAPPVSPAEYFPIVDDWISQTHDARVFLATDQSQYLELMRNRYGERLFSYDAARSSNEVAPFMMKSVPPYKKGEDVLMDILFLSRSDYLIKGASNVGEMALYFSPTLTCTDLSLGKEKAFGQDYGKGWDFQSTKPAWALLKDTDLTVVPENAASQSRVEWTVSQVRKGFVRVFGGPFWKMKDLAERIYGRVVKGR